MKRLGILATILLFAMLAISACDPPSVGRPVAGGEGAGTWSYLRGPNGENCLLYWENYYHGSISGMHCDTVNTPPVTIESPAP